MVMSATDELLEIANHALDAIQCESGRCMQEKSLFSLRDVLVQVLTMLTPLAKYKQVALKYHIDSPVPEHLVGLGVYFQRILLNLIGNAHQFRLDGSVSIFATIGLSELTRYDCVMLELSVKDTGVGISKDQLGIIWDHFIRPSPSPQDKYNGVCVALYAVSESLKAMGGTIEVSSQLGVGSCFTARVPLQLPEPKNKGLSNIDPLIFKRKISILLVEGNPSAVMNSMHIAQSFASFIDYAKNGQEALLQFAKQYYDVVLLDTGLPDINGVTLTKRIREWHDSTKLHVTIVGLAAHGDLASQVKHAVDSGMNYVLTKPTTSDGWQRVIEEHVYPSLLPVESASRSRQLVALLVVRGLLDWDQSVKKCLNNHGLLSELVYAFSDDLPLTYHALKDCFCASDYHSLANMLHKLSGGVSYLSLPTLTVPLERCMTEIRHKNKYGIERTWLELEREIQLFINSFQLIGI